MFPPDAPQIERRAYRYELRPTARQRAGLERMANARRFAYNWGLDRWREHYSEHAETIPFKQLLRELTQLKRQHGCRWLAEVDSQLLQQALFDLREAYRNFFARRKGYPSFKSKRRDQQRFRIPQRVVLRKDRVYVPKIGWVRARVSRPVHGETKSATFKRDAAGKWFVSLVNEFEVDQRAQALDPLRAIGIDLGVRDLLVASDGTRVRSPRFARKGQRRLARAHRDLSRKRRGSRNRAKARLRLARAYRRTANQRQDFLHKLTTELVERHDFIAIEDLGVAGLARTKLAGALLDSGLSEFRRQLTYKARWEGKSVLIVDRFFPSSKRCSACGEVNRKLTPRMRQWACPCGAVHDRDLNAARNLRAAAMRELVAVGRTDTENASGVCVRPPMGAANVEAGISMRRERQHAGALAKPGAGLEPATPALPWPCSTN